MQYSSGSAQITNGGFVFIGDTTVDWTDALNEIAGGKLVFIKVIGSSLVYQVSSITTPAMNSGHTPASRWEANLTGPIGDSTDSTASYVLFWNFTTNYGIPIPNPGDIDVAAIMAYAFAKIDAIGPGPGGGGASTQSYQTATVSAAGNTNSTQSSNRHIARLTVNAGTSAYAQNFVLPTTGRVDGDMAFVHMDFAASTNPTVNIRNATSSGTILWTWTGDGTARSPVVILVYASGAWWLFHASFVSLTPPGTGTGGGQTYQSISISATGNTNSTQSTTGHRIKATIAAGSAYTATIALPLSGRSAGDECRVSMAFPASTGPTVQIRNATSTGTIMWSYNPSDGVARNLWANFVFDGSNWYLDSDGITS